MPGFFIDNAANDNSRHQVFGDVYGKSSSKFIYNYFWEAPKILGKTAQRGESLVYLKDITLPSVSFDKETYTGASMTYKFASNVVYDDLSFVFYDTKGLLDILLEWRKSIWDQTTGVRTAAEYKKDTEIQVFTPQMALVEKYVFTGSWPSSIKYGSLTYTSSDIKFVDVTLTFDYLDESSS